MTIKTQLKAGGVWLNHNETQRPKHTTGLKIKSNIKASRIVWDG